MASQPLPLAKHFVTLSEFIDRRSLITPIPKIDSQKNLRFDFVAEFVLFPFRSPLLREYLLVSFPLGTEMFHFPRSALHVFYNMSHRVLLYGVSPFGNLRIKGCWAPPRSVSPPNCVLHRLLLSRHPPHALIQKFRTPHWRIASSLAELAFGLLDANRNSENRVMSPIAPLGDNWTFSLYLFSCIPFERLLTQTESLLTSLSTSEVNSFFSSCFARRRCTHTILRMNADVYLRESA